MKNRALQKAKVSLVTTFTSVLAIFQVLIVGLWMGLLLLIAALLRGLAFCAAPVQEKFVQNQDTNLTGGKENVKVSETEVV